MLERALCSTGTLPVEARAIDSLSRFRFFKMLSTDEMRAWYGPDHVALAADRGAIGTLLISDELFRYSPCLRIVITH